VIGYAPSESYERGNPETRYGVTTDKEGRYEITYTAERFARADKRSADLMVEARQNEDAGWIAAPIRFTQ